MNLNANGGVIYEYGNEYIVRGLTATTNTELLGKTVVKSATSDELQATSGSSPSLPILLEDVADVRIGAQTPKLGLASERGKPAVLLTVTKQPATSTLELTGKLEAALQDLDIFRQSRFIESSIGNVRKSLVEGGIFVVIVLFLFLANVRTTLISLVTLPLSLVVSVLVLHYMGLTINTMSLGGMGWSMTPSSMWRTSGAACTKTASCRPSAVCPCCRSCSTPRARCACPSSTPRSSSSSASYPCSS